MRSRALPLLAVLVIAVAGGGRSARGGSDGGAPADAAVRRPVSSVPAGAIDVLPGHTTTIVIEDAIGYPLEREPEFVASAPSYRRAIARDRDQQWVEAVGLYQQALVELAAAAQLKPPQQLEMAAFKLDLERRRSRALADDGAGDPASGARQRSGGRASPPRLLPLERARLLRQKLMAVRATTGSTPEGLRSATLGALTRALQEAEQGAAARDPRLPAAPEVRLLLCATLAASGDRAAARAQLAQVGASERSDPSRALTLATCQAALGYRDDALASLAVAINRLGPSSRFLPGPSREIQSTNDWDPLRRDPRFLRLFR